MANARHPKYNPSRRCNGWWGRPFICPRVLRGGSWNNDRDNGRCAARLRLVIHETHAQVLPVGAGIPRLGFVVYPTHRLVKAHEVRNAHRRLRSRLAAYHAAEISLAELDASIRGWINHVGHADSWGLRRHVLDALPIRPAEHRRAKAARRS